MSRSCSPSVFAVAVMLGFLAACSAGRGGLGLERHSGLDNGEWVSLISRDHPLVGRIHDVAADRAVTLEDVGKALSGADIVLLGEQHDNVDHHLVQAWLLRKMMEAGRRPAVAFEQLDVEKQAAVDAALAKAGDSAPAAVRATALADAVDWERSGWPPFDEYRPVFELALAGDLPIRAANLSRRAMGHAPVPTSADPKAASAARSGATNDVALSDEARASLIADITDSHCGYADARMVAMMIEAQRRRDETMASVLLDALALPRASEAVLIGGFGHARNDYGVPVRLRQRQQERRVVSVALLEVIPGLDSPDDYAGALHAARLPFDYVVFTPRADADDPCEKFRAGLEKMKAR